MKQIERIDQLRSELQYYRERKKSCGFVPTMGALHQGHLSLLRQAREHNDVVVCSIFVNPIQFNDPVDLQNYPRSLESDKQMLQAEGCDIVFVPSVEEMYPGKENETYDFGTLEQGMEASHRPGHFNGVAVVVRKLLEIVKPDKVYFGEKDFQQLQIIRKLVSMKGLPTTVVAVPTSREDDGLARSSRNMRLKAQERKAAPEIYRILREAKKKLYAFDTPKQMKEWGLNRLKENSLLQPEYFEVVDMDTLKQIEQWHETQRCIVCVAVFIGEVRLIDNIVLYS
ncbi:MAG: pantoate--beta-alanine ligase [Bacteroidales bacterium]